VFELSIYSWASVKETDIQADKQAVNAVDTKESIGYNVPVKVCESLIGQVDVWTCE
jgi:hypothetical protein